MRNQTLRAGAQASLATLAALMMIGTAYGQAASTTPDITEEMPAPAAADAVELTPELATSDDSGTVERSTPEMRAVIEKLMELGAKPVHTLTVEAARAQPTPTDAVMAVLEDAGKSTAPEAVANVEDIMIPGAAGDLEARVYTPEGEGPFPVIVYFHGGGWVIADLDVYDAAPRALANQAGAVVISVHYRQGPEDKFPAAHEDAIAAYKYVIENAQAWNGDSERVAVAGESAGGNLALNVAIAARDQELNAPEAVLAVYPVAGADLNTPSYIENQNAVPLGKADIEWFVGNYLNSMDEAKDPRIDLVNADLSDLPPVTIIAAEIDPLRSEGETLEEKLSAAGVDVTHELYTGVTHEFFGMAAQVPEAKEAQGVAGERLRDALRSEMVK